MYTKAYLAYVLLMTWAEPCQCVCTYARPIFCLLSSRKPSGILMLAGVVVKLVPLSSDMSMGNFHFPSLGSCLLVDTAKEKKRNYQLNDRAKTNRWPGHFPCISHFSKIADQNIKQDTFKIYN